MSSYCARILFIFMHVRVCVCTDNKHINTFLLMECVCTTTNCHE